MASVIPIRRSRTSLIGLAAVGMMAVLACSSGPAATPTAPAATPTAPAATPTGPAATPTAPATAFKMGFSQIGLTGPFLVGDSYGVVDEAEKLGVEMVFLEAGGFGGLQKQISNTENLIQLPVDALLLDPISDEALKPLVQRAIDEQIPVIGVGDPISNPDIAAAVTSSHTDIGNAMGDAVIAEFNGAPTKVVILAGPPGAQWTTLREAAFEAKLAAAGNFEILTVQWFDDVSRTKGLALTEDFMRTFPEANLFYAADNAIGLGVADAVKTANKAGVVKIVTCVVDNDTVQMIRDGVITIDVAQQVVLIGREGVRVALRVLNGETISPKDVIIPVVTITKDNIDDVNLETMIAPEGWTP